MSHELVGLRHIFIDHSNMWGGDRLASRIKNASIADETARISIKTLDLLLGGKKVAHQPTIVCGGTRLDGEGLWQCTVHVDTTLRDCSEGPTGRNEVWTMQLIRHIFSSSNAPRFSSTSGTCFWRRFLVNEFATSFYEVIEDTVM